MAKMSVEEREKKYQERLMKNRTLLKKARQDIKSCKNKELLNILKESYIPEIFYNSENKKLKIEFLDYLNTIKKRYEEIFQEKELSEKNISE